MVMDEGQMSIRFKLQDAPKWLEDIAITREGDFIQIEILKTNGLPYGHTNIPVERFVTVLDMLIDQKG